MNRRWRLTGLALGAAAARAAYAALNRRPPGGASLWARTNHRGEPVTLLEGPAFVVGATAAAALVPGIPRRVRAAALLAGLATGALGAYDDLAGSASSRGFKGHLGALARGEVTSGAVKILGIGAAGLASAALAGDAPADVLVDGAVIAGSANLLNLFDLRPGRAIKVGLLAGGPVLAGAGGGVAAPALGAAAALLPDDLGERAMLGDAGANALGALLGLAAVTALPRRGRLAVLAGLVALTAASEFVSFTEVIDATPPLRWFDRLGRRPAPGNASASAVASPSPDAGARPAASVAAQTPAPRVPAQPQSTP